MGAKIAATARLPTKFGEFKVAAFKTDDGKEHSALVKGDITQPGALVRVHSECLTGDTFGSRRCDCQAQLQSALRKISKAKNGALVYLRQEGRGIGFANKIRAYSLQDNGMDTVDANLALGFKCDERDYGVAGEILKCLGANDIILLTNNSQKQQGVSSGGVRVAKTIPLRTRHTAENHKYLVAKKEKMGHRL